MKTFKSEVAYNVFFFTHPISLTLICAGVVLVIVQSDPPKLIEKYGLHFLFFYLFLFSLSFLIKGFSGLKIGAIKTSDRAGWGGKVLYGDAAKQLAKSEIMYGVISAFIFLIIYVTIKVAKLI